MAPCTGAGYSGGQQRAIGVSHAVALRDLSELERRLGVDLRVILKKRQQETFALERVLKTAEVSPVPKEARPALRETFVVVLDDKEDVMLGSPAAMRRRSAQSTADLEKGFLAEGTTPKEVIDDLEGRGTDEFSKARDVGLGREGGRSVELRDVRLEI